MAESQSQTPTVEQLQTRIRELEKENQKWMRLAGTNRLTGLPNGLMLYQVILPAELRKGQDTAISLAFILICPDSIGEINQKRGRAVGDRLIAEIAAFLKQHTDPGERLFHPDGANFALMIPSAAEGRARRKATDIRKAFREATFTIEGNTFTDLTCCAGVTAVEEEAIPADAVSQRVEQIYHELSDRLYRAKQRGADYQVGSSRKDA